MPTGSRCSWERLDAEADGPDLGVACGGSGLSGTFATSRDSPGGGVDAAASGACAIEAQATDNANRTGPTNIIFRSASPGEVLAP